MMNVAQAASSTVGTSSPPFSAPAPGEIVKNIYNFALMLGGILAFGMIVYGAVKYTMSGGNPSGQSDARDIITQALLGLLLLMGAFIVLNLINPSLTRLNLPVLGPVAAPKEGPQPAASGGYGCDVTVNGQAQRFCGSRSDCSDISQCAGQACRRIYACVPAGSSDGWGCVVDSQTICTPGYDQSACESSGYSQCRRAGATSCQRIASCPQ